jgi:hypothetical protein
MSSRRRALIRKALECILPDAGLSPPIAALAARV